MVPITETINFRSSTGQEPWFQPRRESPERNRQRQEARKDTLSDLASRLQEIGITTEKKIKDFLSRRGLTNIGILPILDLAVNRIHAKMVSPEKKQDLDDASQKIKDRFLRNVDKREPGRREEYTGLLGRCVDVFLGLILANDDLDRSFTADGSSLYHKPESTLVRDERTHLGGIIFPGNIEPRLWKYSFILTGNPAIDNWIIKIGESNTAIMKIVLRAVGGQETTALRDHWEKKLGKHWESTKKWDRATREKLEVEIRQLEYCFNYLRSASQALVPDTRNPSPRPTKEVKSVLNDIENSKPYTNPREETEPNRIGNHAHRKVYYTTKSGKIIIGSGGETQDGSTTFQGYSPESHWEAATAGDIRNKVGILYTYIPQRRLWAFLASEGFGNVPPTVTGTAELNIDGHPTEVNMAFSEYINGLERITSETDCAPGQLALLHATLYEMYDRDWGEGAAGDPTNIGNCGVVKETGLVHYIDPDITLDAKTKDEPSHNPIVVKDKNHPLTRWPQYGVTFPPYAILIYKNMRYEDVLQKAAQLAALLVDTEAPEEVKLDWLKRVEAWLNRRWLVRELVDKFGCLPRIYNEDGTTWDYLFDPQFGLYNPGQGHLDYIIKVYNSQTPLREAKKD